MELCPRDHSLVALEKAAHILHKPSVVLCQHVFLLRLSGNVGKHLFDTIEERISLDQFSRNAITQQMKSIHMVIFLPEPQRIKCLHRSGICREIHFHDAFDPCFVESSHHVTEFLVWFLRRTVGTLGCKIKSREVAPVVDFVLVMFLADHRLARLHCGSLHKFICRHQLDCIDPKFFPVRDHLLKPCKSASFLWCHLRLSGVASDMDFVEDHVLIRNPRGNVAFPVVFSQIRKTAADPVFVLIL